MNDEIKTKEEYEIAKKRLDIGIEKLKRLWLSEDPKVVRWVNEYEKLAVTVLNYEIENNLLPI